MVLLAGAVFACAAHSVKAAEPNPGTGIPLDLGSMPIGVMPGLTPNDAMPGSVPTDVTPGSVPAGVPLGRMLPAGSFKITYMPVFTNNSGNLIGTELVSPQFIATTIPSFRQPSPTGGVQKIRVVPSDFSSRLQLFGGMYAISDVVNLDVMGSWLNQSLTRTTFAGLSGPNPLGNSTGTTTGLGDTTVSGLIRLYQDASNHVHLNIGLSLPTGGTTKTVTLLNPTNQLMSSRAPYGLQPGSGTLDGLIGLTYTGVHERLSWGAVWRLRLPLDYNSHGYRYGALNEQTAWGGYQILPGVAVTIRADFTQQAHISGHDPQIVNFAEPSDPIYHGGQRFSLLGGLEISGKHLGLPGFGLSLEGGVPVYQNLNGPQLARNWQIIVALSYQFGPH